jgi:hypothetical protein
MSGWCFGKFGGIFGCLLVLVSHFAASVGVLCHLDKAFGSAPHQWVSRKVSTQRVIKYQPKPSRQHFGLVCQKYRLGPIRLDPSDHELLARMCMPGVLMAYQRSQESLHSTYAC